MMVWLKIRRWKLKPILDIKAWDRVQGCEQRGCMRRSRSLSDGWIEKDHRSMCDRRAIVVKLLHDRGPIVTWSWLIWDESTFHQSTGSNGLDFRVKTPFRNDIFSYVLKKTFDWFVKQLRKFWAKSWGLRDSPMFRLNWKAIGARLITTHHRISSNFPLQFRMSASKKSSKFASIHVNWSPFL